MIMSGDGATHSLTDSEREKLHSQHNATSKLTVDTLVPGMPDLESVTHRVSQLLKTTVVSETIEALEAEPELAQWVRQGLALHRGQNAELCRFCEQPLPKHRLAALEAHFNDQYEQLIQRIDQEINNLEVMSKGLENLDLPDEARLYDDYQQEFQTAKAKLTNDLRSTKDFLNTVMQTLKNKKSKVFEAIEFNIEAPLMRTDAVENLNIVIQKHNNATNNLETRRKEARERLANYMIAEDLIEFSKLSNAVDTAKDVVQSEQKNIRCLESEIKKLELQLIEHRRPAEELNEDLRNYLGHDELHLEIKETGYTIKRGNEPANSLSEGEITAIALLYFLKSLQDKDFSIEDGIVVLDDPVSSLDANALFLAFSFIRERTKKAGQLFILTHNFSLLRQVRNWLHHMKSQNKKDKTKRPACFFMLELSFKNNRRNSAIRPLDSLLEKYDSDYHYLFCQVYRASKQPEMQSLEDNYFLPNIARRVLETFLAFSFPDISGGLWQQMEKITFDDAKKHRINRFLNMHSHGVAVGEPEHDPTALAEGPNVLKDLLEMIKSLDDVHYSAMERLVVQGPAEATESDTLTTLPSTDDGSNPPFEP